MCDGSSSSSKAYLVHDRESHAVLAQLGGVEALQVEAELGARGAGGLAQSALALDVLLLLAELILVHVLLTERWLLHGLQLLLLLRPIVLLLLVVVMVLLLRNDSAVLALRLAVVLLLLLLLLLMVVVHHLLLLLLL